VVTNEYSAPTRRRGFVRDVDDFLLHSSGITTLVDQSTAEKREYYTQVIQQRLGIDVSTYSVLNIHRIGIDVPCRFVFRQLLQWDGESLYWPNRIARAERVDGRLEHIEIYLFGWRRFLFAKTVPLFRMKAVEFREQPATDGVDNARFLLFTCEGGYPIGHFTMYLRSPIAALDESEPSQLFLAVGFNVYGRRHLSRRRWALPVSRIWEAIHNRVTSNILYRLKILCEAEFQRLEGGD